MIHAPSPGENGDSRGDCQVVEQPGKRKEITRVRPFLINKPSKTSIMARVKSILPIEGTAGDLTFMNTKDGNVLRKKGGVPKKRVEKAPEFERTRENNAEFSDASAAGKLIRDTFLRTMFIEPDSGCVNRLSVRMLKILQTDMQGARGSRKVSGGNLKLLQGFEFNKESRLRDVLYLLPEPELDRDGGTVTATFEPFIPQCVINAPEKTTHFRFSIGVASLDFTKKEIGH